MSKVPSLASSFEVILNLIERFFEVLAVIFEFFGIPTPGQQS